VARRRLFALHKQLASALFLGTDPQKNSQLLQLEDNGVLRQQVCPGSWRHYLTATLKRLPHEASARDRDLSWDLTKDDFRRLTSLNCHYCGTCPAAALRDYLYNGLDRVNSAWIARLVSHHSFRPEVTPVS
jgi:hypothetical protein